MSKDNFSAREKSKNTKCNFKYYDASFNIPKRKVTSVGVIPFTKDGKIMAVELERGYDVPGGHTQKDDKDFIATANRELREEAFITVKDLKLSTVVESDYFGERQEDLTYMLFYTGFVETINDFIPNEESFSRKVMDKDTFLSVSHSIGDLMSKIVDDAYKKLFGEY